MRGTRIRRARPSLGEVEDEAANARTGRFWKCAACILADYVYDLADGIHNVSANVVQSAHVCWRDVGI